MTKTKRPFSKRPFLLLEVLIAFALVALCVVPLIYPHSYILRAQSTFINSVERNHLAHLLYVDILEKLYQNEYAWKEFVEESKHAIDTSKVNYPYPISYSFVIAKEKTHKNEKNKKIVRLETTLSFEQGDEKEPIEYTFQTVLLRDLKDLPLEEKEEEEKES